MTQLPETWRDARDDCQRRYADLMIIDGQEEQDFITDKIASLKIDLVRFSIVKLFPSKNFPYFNTFRYSPTNLCFALKKKLNRWRIDKEWVNVKFNTTRERSFVKTKLFIIVDENKSIPKVKQKCCIIV